MSDGKLTKLNINPGINRQDTEYKAEGYWVSADKMRFSQDIPEKIGGWSQKEAMGAYQGVARALHVWSTLDGSKLVALGTNNSLWLEEGGQYTDITPIRTSVVAASAFSGTSGSNVVNVSLTGHGAQKNDLLHIDTSTELTDGGQTVSVNLYRIVSAGTDHFDVSLHGNEVATSTYTAEGAVSTTFQFLITAGLIDNGALFGWGSDAYSDGYYGLAGSGGVAVELRQWSLHNWGEDLMAHQKDGALYYYDVSAGGRASIVNAAPTRATHMFLSNPSRQVVLLGTSVQGGDYDPMLVRWSDTEDYTEWTAAATNGAGDYRIPIGSKLVGAMDSKKQHVLFTDEGAYAMDYRGPPNYYEFSRLAGNCGLVGKNAGIDLNGILYWMAAGSFYVYDGTVRQLPSTLDEAIFSETHPYRLNLDQKEKVFCGINTEFSEIWWFYPAGDSIENSRYAIYNYQEAVWYDGTMERTTWRDVDILENPIATAATSVSSSYYEHETGYNDGTAVMPAFIKSGEMQIGDGDDMMFVDQFVPDITQNVPIKVYFEAKKYPQASETFSKGPYTISPNTGKKSMRLRGRSINIAFECTLADSNFRIGANRIRVMPDGKR